MFKRRAKWTWHYVMAARGAVARGFLRNSEIARVLGVSPNTLMQWRERHPELEKAIGEELVLLLQRVRCYERCAERTAIIGQCHAQLDSIMERTGIDYRDPPECEEWKFLVQKRRIEKRVNGMSRSGYLEHEDANRYPRSGYRATDRLNTQRNLTLDSSPCRCSAP